MDNISSTRLSEVWRLLHRFQCNSQLFITITLKFAMSNFTRIGEKISEKWTKFFNILKNMWLITEAIFMEFEPAPKILTKNSCSEFD
jgi:hypothetical protein